ncbi:inositol phosphate phosphatase SopB [Endozoicomonas sp. YOMI1]|uniref:inositol phosphate phosphatase SopB n=1 Tax=Endozoicomonas sp. YOMI1 TaxID=2828739 RepID=UPI002149812A|nr:inositol phosphate phosphatase SopB [Endozoicomonas sp. YOMI1]
MASSIEPNKPGSTSLTHDFPPPEHKISGKKYHKDVSPARLKEPGIQADKGNQGTRAITNFEKIKPVESSPLMVEKNWTVPEQELKEILSTDGELAKINRTNSENHYISESYRALKSLLEYINNGDLNNDLSDKTALNNYKDLVLTLNLPKDLKISLTMPSGDTFCLIPVNSRLMVIDNLQPLINTAIRLTKKIKDSRARQLSQLPPPSRKKEILENINQLLPRVNNPEPFISRLNEIKKIPIYITTDSYKPSPAGVKNRFSPEAKLAITTINTPEKIEKLADQLTAHRKKVQSFIHSTQRLLLENGPDIRWIAAHWAKIEGSLLQQARQLTGSGSKHLSTRLVEITGAIEDDIAGLKRYIQDAAKYDFRGGKQYLKQVDIYAEVVKRLSNTQSAKKNADQKIAAIIDSKRAIALTSAGKVVQCVPEAIQELSGLHRELKKRFKADLFEQVLMKVLAENSESFSSRLHIYQHNQWHQVSLQYTPAASMRLQDDTAGARRGNRDPFQNSYHDKLALSMERNSPHAVNMLAYTMKVDGQETARHIRVGCPYAYKEKGENIDRVTDQRLDEIFTALLLHNHKQALKNAMKNPDHQPIKLDCLYLNLLSPDHIRDSRIARAAGLENEKEWTEKLHKKLMEMSNKERTLTIHYADGKSAAVKIRPRAVMAVTPCNKLALPDRQKSLSGKILLANANTWKTVMEVNRTALQQLVGSNHQYGGLLGKKLPALSASKQHRAKELADQLWALYNTRGGLKQVAEQSGPFYFSGKLKELSAIMGIDLFTGCKSNKDRTGISEAFHQSMLTSGTPDLTEQFMVYGGHIMIQMKNTGLPGYKLDGTQAKQLDDSIFSKLTRH